MLPFLFAWREAHPSGEESIRPRDTHAPPDPEAKGPQQGSVEPRKANLSMIEEGSLHIKVLPQLPLGARGA